MNAKIMKYIPKSKLEAISDAWIDSDGMWITLKDGWNADRMDYDCHVIHEDTIKWLRWQIAGIRKVSPKGLAFEFVNVPVLQFVNSL